MSVFDQNLSRGGKLFLESLMNVWFLIYFFIFIKRYLEWGGGRLTRKAPRYLFLA
jgi:hypothetical protein